MTKQTEKPHQDQAGSLLKSAFRQLEADIRTLDERLVAEGKPIELVLAERAAQLALINDIGRQIAAELELNVLLKRATRLIQATFDYHHVALFLKDEALLKLKAVSGSYQDYFPANHTQRLGEGINGWVATHGEKVVANDVGLEPRYISLISEHSITKAELCLPIKVAGQTIGVLDIQSPTLNAFNQNDIIAMETLTNQVAVAIKNALLYGTAQQELTERKRAELALKQERDRAQKYLDVAGVILVALNEAGQIALINQQGCQLLGYTEAELLGQDWFATCLPSQIRKEVKSVFCQLMTGNTEPVEYYENRILTKTGQERIIAWHSTVLTDEAGAIIGVLASGEDITERKQAEQALRESEARYRTLFNYAQDIIIVENAQHQILDANQAASQFYGYTRQELLTMSTLDLLPSPEQIQEMHPFYTSQNIGEGERFEILTRRRNGLLVPVEITITRLHAGEQTEFLSIIRDITEHKRAEEELQAAVNERTGELIAANEHLRHEISERERVEKALRESEEKYRTLIEQSSDAIYLIYDGKFEIINRRFEELFGVTLEIANRPGFSFSNLIVPKSREKVSELIAGMPEEQKRDRRYEFTALDKAGNPIEIEVSVSYPSIAPWYHRMLHGYPSTHYSCKSHQDCKSSRPHGTFQCNTCSIVLSWVYIK